jgi:hypothetical protein
MEKLDFDDLLIEPASETSIDSRKACYLYQETGYLPLITAPMDTVIDNDNMGIFDDLDIITCLPRGLKNPNGFESYSLKEFNDEFLNSNLRTDGKYLIDIANGHMTSLCETIQTVKKHHPTMTIMAGNIANPATYVALSNAGADYIRCGIGNGAGCFLEGSLVTTDKGDKPIQDIEINDIVLTHTGEYKTVISTIQYPTRENLIKINESISTKTHEYYVLHKNYVDIISDENIHIYAEWVEADKLTNNYFLIETV